MAPAEDGSSDQVMIPEAVQDRGPLEEAWRIFDARHLPYRVLMLGKMFDRLSVQQVRDRAGMSLAEWRVLAHIAVMGPKSASEVSGAALVDRAEVSRAVRSLEAGAISVVPTTRATARAVCSPSHRQGRRCSTGCISIGGRSSMQ